MSDLDYSDPWELVQRGKLDLALATYTELFNSSGRVFYLYNRGLVKLLMKTYASALEDFYGVIERRSRDMLADGDYLKVGTCQWCMGQPQKAISSWQVGLSAKYTDSAGGVVVPATLFFAAIRTHDAALLKEAKQLLQKANQRNLYGWPGLLVGFLLEKTAEAELYDELWRIEGPSLYERFRGQAAFYVGLQSLKLGNRATYWENLETCATNPKGLLEHEYYIARYELDEHRGDK